MTPLPTFQSARATRAANALPDPESKQAFAELLTSYEQEFAPTDDVELRLIQTMAAARVHMLLARARETQVWNEAIDRVPQGELNPSTRMVLAFNALCETDVLDRLLRQEERYSRQYFRAADRLFESRKSNPSALSSPPRTRTSRSATKSPRP